MPKRPSKKDSAGNRNSDRPNGKASKKNPGREPSQFNGKTVNGYTPAALERRAAKRNG